MIRVVPNLLAVAVAFAVAAPVPPGLAATNLLVNPGFEDGGGSYAGWTTFGSGVQISTAATDNIFRSGDAASKIFGEFTGCPMFFQFDVGGYLQSFTPTAGMVYEFSGYSFVSSADPLTGTNTCDNNRAVAKIAFFDAPVGGNEISVNEILIGDGNSTTDQWNSFSVSTPAPAGAMRVEALVLFLQPACDFGSVFVDDLFFCELPPPSPKANVLANSDFSNGLTGWSTFGNVATDSRSFAIRSAPSSAKLFGPFANPGDASGVFQTFAAAPGSEWKLTAWTFTTCQESPIHETNQNFGTLKIVFSDGVGELGFTEETVVSNTSPLGTWTEHTIVSQAPAGTQTVEAFVLFVQPDSTENGAFWVDDVNFHSTVISGVDAAPRALGFELRQNAPNPFGPATRIEFVLDRADVVNLSIYDVRGRRVATLLQDRAGPGPHSVTWNGHTALGRPAATGVYQYVLTTSTGRTSRRMMLIR